MRNKTAMEWAANPSQVTHTKLSNRPIQQLFRPSSTFKLLQLYLLMNILLATEREHCVSVQRKFTLVEDVLCFIFSSHLSGCMSVECRRCALYRDPYNTTTRTSTRLGSPHSIIPRDLQKKQRNIDTIQVVRAHRVLVY